MSASIATLKALAQAFNDHDLDRKEQPHNVKKWVAGYFNPPWEHLAAP